MKAQVLLLVLVCLGLAIVGVSYLLKDAELNFMRRSQEMTQAELELRIGNSFDVLADEIRQRINNQIIVAAAEEIPPATDNPGWCENQENANSFCLSPASLQAFVGGIFPDLTANAGVRLTCVGQGTGADFVAASCTTLAAANGFPKVYELALELRNPNDPTSSLRALGEIQVLPATLASFAGMFYNADRFTFGSGDWRGRVAVHLRDDILASAGPNDDLVRFFPTGGDPLTFRQVFTTNVKATQMEYGPGGDVQFLSGIRAEANRDSFTDSLGSVIEGALDVDSELFSPLSHSEVPNPESPYPEITSFQNLDFSDQEASITLASNGSGSACQNDISVERMVRVRGDARVTDPEALFAQPDVQPLGGVSARPPQIQYPDIEGKSAYCLKDDPDDPEWFCPISLRVQSQKTVAHNDKPFSLAFSNYPVVRLQAPEGHAEARVCNTPLAIVNTSGGFSLRNGIRNASLEGAGFDPTQNVNFGLYANLEGATQASGVLVDQNTRASDGRTLWELVQSGSSLSPALRLDAKVISVGNNNLPPIALSDFFRSSVERVIPGAFELNGGMIGANSPVLRFFDGNKLHSGFQDVNIRFLNGAPPGAAAQIFAELVVQRNSFAIIYDDIRDRMLSLGLDWNDDVNPISTPPQTGPSNFGSGPSDGTGAVGGMTFGGYTAGGGIGGSPPTFDFGPPSVFVDPGVDIHHER